MGLIPDLTTTFDDGLVPKGILKATPLEFLQAVYCNEGLPISVRMRAAIEAAPFIHPKLSVSAQLNSDDFADRLTRAVNRSSRVMKMIDPPKIIDQSPPPDRRLRRV
jgi:hypothetical protein